MSGEKVVEMLGVRETALRLGVKECTIRAWILRRKIGYVKLNGAAVRIPASEVERIIKRGFVPAREPRQ